MGTAPTERDTLVRLLHQHAATSRLLDVDFLPLARPSDGAGDDIRQDVVGDSPTLGERERVTDRVVDKQRRLAELRDRYEREARVPKMIKGWNKIVFSDGSPDAELMFIGEAPGADEDAQGVPFVGRAGQKLTEMIVAMGLRREDVHIANVLKVRPPDNRTPTPEEAALDGPYLVEQIRIVSPRVIVTLGRPAAQFILDSTESMGALRGRWHTFEGIPVMPTYHPAYLLRAYTPENRKKVWSDLQMAMEQLTGR